MGKKLQLWSDRESGSERRLRRTGAAIGVSLLAVAVLGVVVVSSGEKPRRKKSKSRNCKLGSGGGTLGGIPYQELVTGGAKADDTLPMVVAFHGRGASPEALRPFLENLKAPARIILPQGDPLGSGHAWWTTRAKGDQDELASDMSEAASRLARFVAEIASCRPTRGQPILAGHSQGGMMTLALASIHPQVAAQSVAASAWLPESLWGEGMSPVILIHGDRDDLVPFGRSQDMVEEVTALGNDWEFQAVTGHGHGLAGPLESRWIQTIEQALKK